MHAAVEIVFTVNVLVESSFSCECMYPTLVYMCSVVNYIELSITVAYSACT